MKELANYFYLTLDTTAPASPSISIANGAVYATNPLVTLGLGTGDAATSGYQMKIWGDIDEAYDTSIKKTEATTLWIAYTASKQIKLLTGDGNKTISYKLRDDVYNESGIATDTITLDTAQPVPSFSTPDAVKISKIAGKNIASVSLSSSKPFTEYKVKVVTSLNATHDTGTLIGTEHGSVNTSGTGTFSTPITISVTGADLEAASSGDGQKTIKVFIKNAAGTWSA